MNSKGRRVQRRFITIVVPLNRGTNKVLKLYQRYFRKYNKEGWYKTAEKFWRTDSIKRVR